MRNLQQNVAIHKMSKDTKAAYFSVDDVDTTAKDIKELCGREKCSSIVLGKMTVNNDWSRNASDVTKTINCDNDCYSTWNEVSTMSKGNNPMPDLATKLQTGDFSPTVTHPYSSDYAIGLSNSQEMLTVRAIYEIPPEDYYIKFENRDCRIPNGPNRSIYLGSHQTTDARVCAQMCNSMNECGGFGHRRQAVGTDPAECWFHKNTHPTNDCTTLGDPNTNQDYYKLINSLPKFNRLENRNCVASEAPVIGPYTDNKTEEQCANQCLEHKNCESFIRARSSAANPGRCWFRAGQAGPCVQGTAPFSADYDTYMLKLNPNTA